MIDVNQFVISRDKIVLKALFLCFIKPLLSLEKAIIYFLVPVLIPVLHKLLYTSGSCSSSKKTFYFSSNPVPVEFK